MKSGSTGSRTRVELKKLKQKFKKGLNISRPALSRILSGKARLSVKALYRLIEQLDTESATRLVAAYLSDLIPRKLQDQLCVCVREQQKGDCCWQYWDPFVQKILQLPSEPRLLLERVTDAILHPLGESPLPPGSRDHTQAQGLPTALLCDRVRLR